MFYSYDEGLILTAPKLAIFSPAQGFYIIKKIRIMCNNFHYALAPTGPATLTAKITTTMAAATITTMTSQRP